MEFNNKRLEKTSKFINYTIAVILCGFLISLSGKIIDDVDEWKERPKTEQFENKSLIDSAEAIIEKVEVTIGVKQEQKDNLENTIKIARSNYENAKQSYDNWLAARVTLGSPNEDKEVLSRANELDEYYKTEQEWRQKQAGIEKEISALNKENNELYDIIDEERSKAYKARNKAIQKYELKVFLIRLLFILPVLLLGIYFIIKFRKHKYWPLFFGFVLFSFYAFFFGLVPYLPSYGGYVRYAVGIILSVAFGIYAINKIKAFIEKKKEELKVSTTERAKKVKIETAEKALDKHMCPSCGKDFIAKKWDNTIEKKKVKVDFGFVTNYCRYCGLELFKKCKFCETQNFAHLPYCSHCGDNLGNQ